MRAVLVGWASAVAVAALDRDPSPRSRRRSPPAEAAGRRLTVAPAPATSAILGCGPDTVSALLVAIGDNPDRLRSEAAFPHLAASSGKTNRRRPLRKPRPAHRRRHPPALRPTQPRLCHPPHRPTRIDARDHPLSEALPRHDGHTALDMLQITPYRRRSTSGLQRYKAEAPVLQRAAVMPELGVIEIQQRDRPQAGAQQCVVKLESVGVCGSDVAYFTAGRIGDYVVDGPIILGHEASGTVVEMGSNVTNVELGDRVAIEPGSPCRNCGECLAGRYHLCPDLVFLATPPYDGALQEYIVIDSRSAFPMPDSMSFDEGALLEPLSVGIWGCHLAGLSPGDDVLVTGAGPVGLLASSAARAFGARNVVVSDISDFRLEMAARLGFEAEGVDKEDSRADRHFDVLLECSGADGVLAAGLQRLRAHGRAAMIGMPKKDVVLPLARLNPREISVHTVNRYAHTWPVALSLVASGRVDVAPLVTHRFALAETVQALTLSQTVNDSMKAIVCPQL